jgi:hypothetical protein
MSHVFYPEDVDARLNWPLGTALRLARRKKLPHVLLPDGSVRFVWADIEALLRRVPASGHVEGTWKGDNQ